MYKHSVTAVLGSDVVKNFCESISKNEPMLIDLSPAEGALIRECYENVEKYVGVNGGERVLGWSIMEVPNLYIEAECHAVWKNNGVMLDITPREYDTSRVLFLPDETIDYQGVQINNKRLNIRGLPIIDDFFSINNEIFEINNSAGNEHKKEFILKGAKAIRYEELGMAHFILRNQIFSQVTDSIYQACPCGCGRKNKFCDFK